MAETEKETLEASLTDYKEKISTVTKATLNWDRELIFTGSTPQGYEIEFDAQAQWGCKPTEALLLSLAGCMGIDVVSMLTKMRVRLAGFKLDIVGERNPVPPQYFKSVEIIMNISGENVDAQKVDRAVALSRDKYCSVYNSLRQDLVLNVRYVIEAKEPPGEHS
jgi:putative redox protein